MKYIKKLFEKTIYYMVEKLVTLISQYFIKKNNNKKQMLTCNTT